MKFMMTLCQTPLSSGKEMGLDGIISGEPQGQTLALILRMWAPRLRGLSISFSIDFVDFHLLGI